MNSRSHASRSLRKYTKGFPTAEELDALLTELSGEGHRASAIVGAAMLENLLRDLLDLNFPQLTETESKELFSQNGPLDTFAAKIQIAYAMQAIDKPIRDDLNHIREIRNAFAHTFRNVSYETKEISTVCSRLKSFKGKLNEFNITPWPPVTAHMKYLSSVYFVFGEMVDAATRKFEEWENTKARSIPQN